MIDALKDEIYHSLFTAAPDAVLIMDAAGNIVSSNPSAQALLGYSEEGLRGLTLASLISGRHRDTARPERADYAGNPDKSRTNDKRALHARHRDGSELMVEVNLTPTENGLVLATVRDVTELKRAAEALREHQAQRDLKEEMAHLGSWELNFASKRLTWSNEVYRIFGLPPQAFDASCEAFLERVHPDDRAAVENAYLDSLRENRDIYETEHRIIRKDNGETRIVHEKCQHFRDSAGRLVRSVGMVHDITERKRAAAALEESEARFRATFEQAAVGIAHVGPDGRWLRVNRKLCEIVGYSQEELLARTFQDITHPDDLGADLDCVCRMLARELDTYSMEKRYLRKDGNGVWINLTVALVWKPNGTPDYFISVVEEIQARKEAEAALRESEEKLKLFIEHAPAALIMLDRDMRHIAVSRRWMDDLSLGDQNIIGRLHYEVMPEVPERFRVAHQRGLAGEVVECDADRFERLDGSVQWGRWAVWPWHTADGAVGGIVIFAEDISERKRDEAALQAMQAEMEQLMRFQVASQTVSALAHELNQPLNAVASYAEAALRLLHAGNPQPDKLLHALESSAQQAQRAGRVLGELFAFMKQGEVQTEAVDLNDLVRGILGRIDTNDYAGFRTSLEPDPSPSRVSVNRLQVEKVMLNLIQNGFEAMRDAGTDTRSIDITVRTSADRRMAQVTVRDGGPGIDAQTRHRIFEPFFTTKPKGLGMGLAVSRAIIESHGGQLWVESEPGAGASFHLTLPFTL